ncbi:MAG: ferritin-like domain-containing protein [Armatimonas sp.]
MTDLNEIRRNPLARRDFLLRMGAAGLGAAALAVLQGCSGGNNDDFEGATGLDPVNFPNVAGRSADEIALNFALTAEILEADLYRQALNKASGRAATAPLDSSQPAAGTTGGYSLTVDNGSIDPTLSAAAFLYLVQYAYVEAAHRDFLTVTLQSLGAPVATRNPNGYKASFGDTLSSILTALYNVEEEGVRAYLGAAGYFTNPTLQTTAVAIYSTECRHAAALAYVLGKNVGPVHSGRDLRVTDGVDGVYPNPSDENSLEYYRTPRTVLSDLQDYLVK